MIRKLLILMVLLALGGGTAYWLSRRLEGSREMAQESAQFLDKEAGAGRLLQLQAVMPLRGVRWLQPLPGGYVLCHASTQSDRHWVGIFREGRLQSVISLVRPEGVSEGAFRQAELWDARVMEGQVVLLLGTGRDKPLLMVLGPEGTAKGIHRIDADRLASEGRILWAWGPQGAQRIPASGALPPAVAWPAEVNGPSALLPAGTGFLLAHAKGLSAWQGNAWTHHPAPPSSPLGFSEPRSALAACGGAIYWQPEPGSLLRVDARGGVVGSLDLPAPEGQPLDGSLLKLLGADGVNRLWFALAVPRLDAAALDAPPPPPEADKAEGWTEESPATPAPATAVPVDFEPYRGLLAQPMDRLHVWKPGAKALQTLVWSQRWTALSAPSSLTPPPGDGALRPEGGGFLFGGDMERWWVPLAEITR